MIHVMNQPTLKELRQATPLTATFVAELMGVSQPVVSRLESGRHKPRPATLARYYTAIGRYEMARELYWELSADEWSAVDAVRAALERAMQDFPAYAKYLVRPEDHQNPMRCTDTVTET